MSVKNIVERNSRFTQFPWRNGNSFRLLIDAHEFVPVMLDSIAQARKYVLIEMYLIESSDVTTRFIDSILETAKRGINFYILLDDFGTRGLKQNDRARLNHQNIKLAFYNPLRWPDLKHYFFRDHRKLLLVDNEIAFTGSAGITDYSDPANNMNDNWRETMIEIKGPVLNDWKTLFEGVWSHSTTEPLSLPENSINDDRGLFETYGRLVHSRPIHTNSINRSVLRHGLLAKQLIWISTAYFNPPGRLRRMLCKKARQNIDVRILLPGEHSDHPGVRYFGHRHYALLLRAGVRIFEFQPRFMHSKVALCDDWCSIGSSNFDRWELPRNLEANQEITDPVFATQIRKMMENDFTTSQEISTADWARRPWGQRIKEWFWSQLGRFFDPQKRDTDTG